MSRRMLDVLLSVGEFAHRAIPVRLVDDWVLGPRRWDENGRLRPEAVDDRFVALQLTQHIDAFDRERSEYEADDLFPDEIGIVRKLVLREPDDGFPPLFRLAEKPQYLFVSVAARRRLQAAGVQGAVFWGLDQIKV